MSKKPTAELPMDLALLEEHLSIGIIAFERSIFGAMIDAIENRSYVAKPCPRCLAAGILFDGKWCGKCGGIGWTMARRGHSEPFSPITARPNESLHSHACSTDQQAARITNYAIMSRRLSRLTQLHEWAMRAAFGDRGAKWADSPGRWWACLPFTKSGAELLRTDESTIGKAADPLTRITELVRINDGTPKVQRTRLLSRAIQEATMLLSAAIEQWNIESMIDHGSATDVA